VGELVRQGQEEGTIRTRADSHRSDQLGRAEVENAKDAIGASSWSDVTDVRRLAEATPADFDTAIDEAKAEGNLSRANVVRKVKGEAPKPERSEWHHKKRHIDPLRIAERLAEELDAATTGLDLVPDGYLPTERKLELVTSINQSIDTIRKAVRKW